MSSSPDDSFSSLPLPLLLLSEASTALATAFCVAPFVTVIDRAIIQNAAGTSHLWPAIKTGAREILLRPWNGMLRNPVFLLMWMVYGGTYVTANTIEVLSRRAKRDFVYPKFLGTSVTNIVLSTVKDRAYTRNFGKVAPKALPVYTYGLFWTRDMMTMAAAFTLPAPIAHHLHAHLDIPLTTAQTASQLILPCSIQLLSTPIHLAALDMYNRPDATLRQRAVQIRREYAKSVLARMGRILPALGIGGVLNGWLRERARAGAMSGWQEWGRGRRWVGAAGVRVIAKAEL
ncbi:hypothetical protein M427DRAFT_97091 [Gonapodya prolifera JEL478]|uniref:Mitochondrial carrier n=1 Tax=Gonapodya prolifera (strain JEL478) TaxID=1344416 RepID=A0A139AKX4_GONPJ|nr:hypothetical protein M427DRAFT_97091 [Gonapodya prolifera JEL478]|eukprot:KXS17451.1 hypothetical protein M427DRAFT_97091 [Gonapodya prolifera JEL478]